jgi:hypothetical protein
VKCGVAAAPSARHARMHGAEWLTVLGTSGGRVLALLTSAPVQQHIQLQRLWICAPALLNPLSAHPLLLERGLHAGRSGQGGTEVVW